VSSGKEKEKRRKKGKIQGKDNRAILAISTAARPHQLLEPRPSSPLPVYLPLAKKEKKGKGKKKGEGKKRKEEPMSRASSYRSFNITAHASHPPNSFYHPMLALPPRKKKGGKRRKEGKKKGGQHL